MVLTGHLHYVMWISVNPHNPNILASCSLDRTVRIWEVDFQKHYERFKRKQKSPRSNNFVNTLKNIFNLNSSIQTLDGFQDGLNCRFLQRQGSCENELVNRMFRRRDFENI